jgi:predicted peptidase
MRTGPSLPTGSAPLSKRPWRWLVGALVLPLALTGVAPAAAAEPAGIISVAAVTEVSSFGQQVTAVVVEYGQDVDASDLAPADFLVRDTGYNFRFDPIESLPELVDRDVSDVFTTDDPSRLLDEARPQSPGRFVVLDLADDPEGGWTVMVSLCPTFLCSVKVNPAQPTQVTQLADVHGTDGAVISAGDDSTAWPLTEPSINREVDQFVHGALPTGVVADETAVLPAGELLYDYRLPDGYSPDKSYPLVVVLPGHGMGYDGQNERVQLAADIPATAWFQQEWTGTDEQVIVLAPQNERLGKQVEGAQVVALVEDFVDRFSVDRSRVYASSVSYGSQLMWEMFSTRPDLFAAGLLTGGFPADDDEFAPIAEAEVPMWITHGTNDHLLPVARARASFDSLVAAYEARGLSPERIGELVRWTEYADDAFSLPDRHLAAAPTYEDSSILQWLLAQQKEIDPVDPGVTPGGGGAVSPTAPVPGAASDPARLAATGSTVSYGALLAALVVLVGGFALMIGGRRRRIEQ